MKKHSPNFHTNLEEADNATNNRAATFFWTVVTVALFLLGFSLTSCTKEVSKPVLRPPQRSVNAVDVTIKFYAASHQLVNNPVHGLEIRTSQPMKVKTTFHITWQDVNYRHQLEPYIRAGENIIRWETMLPIIKEATDLKLVKVDGDTTIVYRLKQIL